MPPRFDASEVKIGRLSFMHMRFCSWFIAFNLYVNDVPHPTQGSTMMYVDDTSVLNIGQNINELQYSTLENTGLIEKYFETNDLSLNPTKTLHLCHMKQCRKESELKI
jgi:hypothetical protein